MKVIRKNGMYYVTGVVNGKERNGKFLVGSKKEAIKKFKEKHKQEEK